MDTEHTEPAGDPTVAFVPRLPVPTSQYVDGLIHRQNDTAAPAEQASPYAEAALCMSLALRELVAAVDLMITAAAAEPELDRDGWAHRMGRLMAAAAALDPNWTFASAAGLDSIDGGPATAYARRPGRGHTSYD